MVKYNRLRPVLQKANIELVMIGIGKPEIAQRLCNEHLELTRPEEFIFADPDNSLYSLLDLNFNLFTPATAFSFLERFSTKGGMNDLNSILSKWLPRPGVSEGAVILPPRQKQAFNQGGTFVFNGGRTLLAHYDASTGAHANFESVQSIAMNAV